MLAPLGYCPVCGQPVPGTTAARRYTLCRVRLGLHWHFRNLGWCIGSNALARPVGA